MTVLRAKRLYRTIAVFLGIFVFLGAFLASVMIADMVTERYAHTVPSYDRVDISALAEKEGEWTEEELHTLYLQTGLGKSALLEMRTQKVDQYGNKLEPFPEELKKYQDALFYEGEITHEHVADVSNRDLLKNPYARVAPVMQAGDVLVNSSTHTLGFRNGHAALVLNEYGDVLESFQIGYNSAASDDAGEWFAASSNFLLLRLKDVDAQMRSDIAENALHTLSGIPYTLTVGIFSKKYQGERPKGTQCAHLVWQAFKNAGYDVDSNRGIVVTPRDIARSPLFEVVQVYGFDPEKLW